MSKILEGKKGLVVGIANDHSIAWGIAKSLSDEGASMYLTYQNDSIKKRVCLLYTSPSPRDQSGSRMPSSA